MKINLMKLCTQAVFPTQAKPGDAAYDLYAVEDVIIGPGERRPVKTGIAIEIPPGYHGRILPRSGLALKHGIDTMAGVIDASYRGEIIVLLINLDSLKTQTNLTDCFFPKEGFRIKAGDRIAQLRISKQEEVEWVEVESLAETERGKTGFGASGV